MGRITGLGSDPQLLRSITVSANGQVLPNATVLPVGLPFTALMEQILESGAAPTFGLTSDQEAGIVGAKTPLSATNAVATAADVAIQQQRIDTLVTGAPAALNTLAEIAAQIAADEQGVAGILATQNRNTQQITTNTTAIGIIQRAVVVGANVGNGNQAAVQVGGYSNTITGLESASVGGGGNTIAGNDSATVGGYQLSVPGVACGAIAAGYSQVTGQLGFIAAVYSVANKSAYSAVIASSYSTLPVGADKCAIIGGGGFTAPVATDTVYMPQISLFKAGAGVTLLSPDGKTSATLTISNMGALLLNGVAVGSSSGPTITNPTFTAA